ncbi:MULTISPECIES: hypothetical protein [Rahnella]|uniref:hypothetical protein n=1 Tax=Rahnella TaxID=34037 RepID=UPI00104C1E68|nr:MULTISPECIES: hypothetical protein [Rahnella]TCQ89378.1 hypothetical protein EC840_104285 [Rahnella sp. JUb53]
MSKLSKLIKTPDLYFKDAMNKRFSRKKIIVDTKKQSQREVIKTSPKTVVKHSIDITKTKINIVILDNIKINANNKKNIVKYQLRSIEKYSNFSSISYISEDILISDNKVSIFKSYADFYKEKVLSTYPKIENYVFVNLNFFFLKKVSYSNFISDNGKKITYFKKNKGKTTNLDHIISKIIDGGNYNFTPMENFSIIDTVSLIYLEEINTNNISKNEFIFKLPPIIDAILNNNILVESPIQYARLDSGYIEKFVWIQSVHGSNRCPLAITFDKEASNDAHYNDFLDSLFPHASSFEAAIKII